ncbi:MAG: YihY/virulence factor BrkB family protein [Pseudomonadota bacterium]
MDANFGDPVAPEMIERRGEPRAVDLSEDARSPDGRSDDERSEQAQQVLGPAGFIWALVTAATTKNLSHVAAGVAFYMLLSMFPAIAVALSLIGLFADPSQMEGYLDALRPILPADAFGLIETQVKNTMAAGGLKLSAAAVISFGIAFWSASAVVRALMTAMHMSFEAARGLNLFVYFLLSFIFTLMGVGIVALALGMLVVLPLAIEALRALTENRIVIDNSILNAIELPIMIFLVTLVLMAIYRMGSARGRHATRAAFLSAITTTLLWLGASRLLFYYFSAVGDLATTYGPLGAVAGLMLWFWISAFMLLLGAEFANIASGGRPSDRTEMS